MIKSSMNEAILEKTRYAISLPSVFFDMLLHIVISRIFVYKRNTLARMAMIPGMRQSALGAFFMQVRTIRLIQTNVKE